MENHSHLLKNGSVKLGKPFIYRRLSPQPLFSAGASEIDVLCAHTGSMFCSFSRALWIVQVGHREAGWTGRGQPGLPLGPSPHGAPPPPHFISIPREQTLSQSCLHVFHKCRIMGFPGEPGGHLWLGHGDSPGNGFCLWERIGYRPALSLTHLLILKWQLRYSCGNLLPPVSIFVPSSGTASAAPELVVAPSGNALLPSFWSLSFLVCVCVCGVKETPEETDVEKQIHGEDRERQRPCIGDRREPRTSHIILQSWLPSAPHSRLQLESMG